MENFNRNLKNRIQSLGGIFSGFSKDSGKENFLTAFSSVLSPVLKTDEDCYDVVAVMEDFYGLKDRFQPGIPELKRFVEVKTGFPQMLQKMFGRTKKPFVLLQKNRRLAFRFLCLADESVRSELTNGAENIEPFLDSIQDLEVLLNLMLHFSFRPRKPESIFFQAIAGISPEKGPVNGKAMFELMRILLLRERFPSDVKILQNRIKGALPPSSKDLIKTEGMRKLLDFSLIIRFFQGWVSSTQEAVLLREGLEKIRTSVPGYFDFDKPLAEFIPEILYWSAHLFESLDDVFRLMDATPVIISYLYPEGFENVDRKVEITHPREIEALAIKAKSLSEFLHPFEVEKHDRKIRKSILQRELDTLFQGVREAVKGIDTIYKIQVTERDKSIQEMFGTNNRVDKYSLKRLSCTIHRKGSVRFEPVRLGETVLNPSWKTGNVNIKFASRRAFGRVEVFFEKKAGSPSSDPYCHLLLHSPDDREFPWQILTPLSSDENPVFLTKNRLKSLLENLFNLTKTAIPPLLIFVVLFGLGFVSEVVAQGSDSISLQPGSGPESLAVPATSPIVFVGSESTSLDLQIGSNSIPMPDVGASGSAPIALQGASSLSASISEQLEAGQKLGRSGDYARAKDVFRSILADEPENSKALFFLGICYGKLGQPSEAERFLTRLEKVDKNLSEKLKASLAQDAKKALARSNQPPKGSKKPGGEDKNASPKNASGTQTVKNDPGRRSLPVTPPLPKIPAKAVRFLYFITAQKGPLALVQFGEDLRLAGTGDQIADWMYINKITPDGIVVVDPKDPGRKATFLLIGGEFSPKSAPKAQKMINEIRKKWSGHVPETERLGVPVIKIYERDGDRFAIINWNMRKLLVQTGEKVDDMFQVSTISSDSVEIVNLFNQLPETYKPGEGSQ